MRKFSKILAVVLALIFMGQWQMAYAKIDFEGGETVNLSQKTYSDDLMAAGAMVNGDLQVTGDSFVVGSNVDLGGNYSDDLNVAGGQVKLDGNVRDNLRMAGGSVESGALVGGNMMVAGGQVNIQKEAVISGSMYATGGMIVLDGKVKENAHIAGGQVVINGQVDGDLTIEAEEVTLGENAKIGKNFKYTSKKEIANIKEGQVLGETRWQEMSELDLTGVAKVSTGAMIFSWISSFVIGLLMMFFVGLALILLLPDFSDRSSRYFSKKMAASLLYGLLVLIVWPILSVILMITIVGFPLGMIMMAIYFIAWYVAKLIAALSVGSALTGRRGANVMSLLISFAVGLLVFEIITSIPWIGWIVNLVMIATAIGAMWIAFSKKSKPEA